MQESVEFTQGFIISFLSGLCAVEMKDESRLGVCYGCIMIF